MQRSAPWIAGSVFLLLWMTSSCSKAGDLCGGPGGDTCSGNLYCYYPDHSCGLTGSTGYCAEMPEEWECSVDGPEPDGVCGCDGTVYRGSCSANNHGQDITSSANCSLSPGDFRCGDLKICMDGLSSYCLEQPWYQGSTTIASYCTVSSTCGGHPDCSCLVEEVGCGQCSEDPNGNLTISCE